MMRPQPETPETPLRVAIVANYSADAPSSNNRFNDLARRFVARGADVELITTTFSHGRKRVRDWDFGETEYTITRLHEPGYRKNISAARLRSQSIFARQVGRYLASLEQPPHVLLAAVPPPRVAFECARYAQSVGAAFAVDIQDVWPEAFSMVAPFPRAVDLLFSGMRRASAAAYRSADRVIGVSRTFTDSAARYGADPQRTRVVYLGTELSGFDENAALNAPGVPGDEGRAVAPTVGYVGSLNASYDLRLVVDALALLAAAPDAPPVPALIVMGDGELRGEFEAYARGKDLDIRFTGNLPYTDMVRTLSTCQIAVNPLVPGFGGSVINKVCDYAAAGLPVVNSQDSPEYRGLLERYDAGISCDPSDAAQMATAIRRLVDDPGLRTRMGTGSRRMAEELFDRSVTYESLVDELLELASGTRAARAPGHRSQV